MNDTVDVLAFASHPDDAELGCSGTLLKLKSRGRSIGIVDLTAGELGTRGTAEIRMQEARESAILLGLSARECLNLPDGFFNQGEDEIRSVISAIRTYRPKVLLINAPSDRHPDHGNGSDLVLRAAFLAGLPKIESIRNGQIQAAWRPKAIFHYIQFRHHRPDFVVDISDFMQKKLEVIQAFRSQFYNPESDEPETLIASDKFLKYVEARAREMGAAIERNYGEGFVAARTLEVVDPFVFI